MSLMDLYRQKYGTEKTAAPKADTPVEKTAAQKVRSFQEGKVAAWAFNDEIKKLNAADIAELEKKAAQADPLVQLLKKIQ